MRFVNSKRRLVLFRPVLFRRDWRTDGETRFRRRREGSWTSICASRAWEDLVEKLICDGKVLEATGGWLETAEKLLGGTFSRTLQAGVVLSAHAIAYHGDVVLGGARARDARAARGGSGVV